MNDTVAESIFIQILIEMKENNSPKINSVQVQSKFKNENPKKIMLPTIGVPKYCLLTKIDLAIAYS